MIEIFVKRKTISASAIAFAVMTPVAMSSSTTPQIGEATSVFSNDVFALRSFADSTSVTQFNLQIASLSPTKKKPAKRRKRRGVVHPAPESSAANENILYASKGHLVRETTLSDAEFQALMAESVINAQSQKKPIIEVMQPVVTRQTVKPRNFSAPKPGVYGRFTDVVGPLDKEQAATKFRSSLPAVSSFNVELVAPSAKPTASPWAVPVSANLSNEKTVAGAMTGMLRLVGYRLVLTGPAVDKDAVNSLSAPVPLAQKHIEASNLIQALTAIAGPGLTVVIDHTHRAVSVDTSPRSAMLTLALK